MQFWQDVLFPLEFFCITNFCCKTVTGHYLNFHCDVGLRTSEKEDREIFFYLHKCPKYKCTALTPLSGDG